MIAKVSSVAMKLDPTYEEAAFDFVDHFPALRQRPPYRSYP